MWYALLDIRNEVNGMTWLAYGTLKDIANEVIEQCWNCDPEARGSLDFEALDEEGFYYEEDDYLALYEADTITPDLLQGFSFTLSGACVSVYCLAQGYTDFRQKFDGYDGDTDLEELILPESVDPAEEEAFAEELADILFTEEYYGDLDPSRKYVTKRENEE